MPLWLFWTIAAVLFLGAVALLYWGFWGDRSKGRLRCPKCWYDMTGSFEAGKLVCPECGLDAGKDKRLRKNHRRWWAICISAPLLCVQGYSTFILTGWYLNRATVDVLENEQLDDAIVTTGPSFVIDRLPDRFRKYFKRPKDNSLLQAAVALGSNRMAFDYYPDGYAKTYRTLWKRLDGKTYLVVIQMSGWSISGWYEQYDISIYDENLKPVRAGWVLCGHGRYPYAIVEVKAADVNPNVRNPTVFTEREGKWQLGVLFKSIHDRWDRKQPLMIYTHKGRQPRYLRNYVECEVINWPVVGKTTSFSGHNTLDGWYSLEFRTAEEHWPVDKDGQLLRNIADFPLSDPEKRFLAYMAGRVSIELLAGADDGIANTEKQMPLLREVGFDDAAMKSLWTAKAADLKQIRQIVIDQLGQKVAAKVGPENLVFYEFGAQLRIVELLAEYLDFDPQLVPQFHAQINSLRLAGEFWGPKSSVMAYVPKLEEAAKGLPAKESRQDCESTLYSMSSHIGDADRLNKVLGPNAATPNTKSVGLSGSFSQSVGRFMKVLQAPGRIAQRDLKRAEMRSILAMSMGDKYMYGRGVKQDYAEALKWFGKAADLGNARAMQNLGYMYMHGQGVKQNDTEAVKWFGKAADLGSAYAMQNLGYLYSNGQGVKQDYAEALKWFGKAADLGSADAMQDLGYMYVKGQGVKKDYAEALKWFGKAADRGEAVSMYNIGVMYEKGLGVKKDDAEAFEWYRKAAYAGYEDAMYELGERYHDGKGVKQDYAVALQWYRKAADGGNADAMYQLAILYILGLGVKQDYTEAAKWYRKAADAGDTGAMYRLGRMYEDGKGVEKDEAEALKWYRKAAEGNPIAATDLKNWKEDNDVSQFESLVYTYRRVADGEAEAMKTLGLLYEYGINVKQDHAQAHKWYRKAADKGNAEAMVDLGRMYEYGRGAKQDYTQAFKWYRKSADLGNAGALADLGYLYYDGRGVSRDIATSLQLFQRAQKASPRDYQARRIWLCLGLLGKKDEAAASLKQYRTAHKSEDWYAHVFSFMAGEISDEKLLELTKTDDAKRQKMKLRAAYFYIGSMKLIEGDKTAAVSYFDRCVKTGITNVDYLSAKAELERLNKK